VKQGTETTHEEGIMKPVTGLFAALVSLSVISTVVEAADGCGRGWYFNGETPDLALRQILTGSN
jgi:hypothetical protein